MGNIRIPEILNCRIRVRSTCESSPNRLVRRRDISKQVETAETLIQTVQIAGEYKCGLVPFGYSLWFPLGQSFAHFETRRGSGLAKSE